MIIMRWPTMGEKIIKPIMTVSNADNSIIKTKELSIGNLESPIVNEVKDMGEKMPKFKAGEEIWIDTFKDIFVITKILNGLFYNLVDSDGHEYKGICEDELHATSHTMLTELGFEEIHDNKVFLRYKHRNTGDWLSFHKVLKKVTVGDIYNNPSPIYIELLAALTQLMREQSA